MFDNIIKFFKKFSKEENKDSKDTAKERLHLVLMQDRANVSADFLELMKQEIIEVIKKYIDVDENSIDVKLTNKVNGDGTTGAPALYANIPIISIKEETKKVNSTEVIQENKKVETKEDIKKEDVKEESIKEEKLEETKVEVEDIEKKEVINDNKTENKDEEKVEDKKIEEEKIEKDKKEESTQNKDKIEVE